MDVYQLHVPQKEKEFLELVEKQVKLLTRELVESLDLVVASPVHPLERQDIESIKLVSEDKHSHVLEEWKGEQLKEVKIFAAMLDFHRLFSYISHGVPKKDEQFLYVNISFKREGNSLLCLYGNAFENAISNKDHSVYFGAHEWGKAIVFDKPLAFDPQKELLLVRSPNKSVNFDSVLYQTSLKEKIVMGDWIIINENGIREAKERDLTTINAEQRELFDRYFLGNYEKKISLEETAGRIILTTEIAPELPVFEKLPGGGYKSIPGRGLGGEFKRFAIESIGHPQDFDPLTFDPNNTKFKEFSKEDLRNLFEASKTSQDRRDYYLIYASPCELLRGRSWAFSNAIDGDGTLDPAIKRYKNHHLVE